MINRNPSSDELKKFGIIFSIFLSIFFGIILTFIFKKNINIYYWAVPVAIIFLLSIVLPKSLKYLFLLWMTIAYIIGRINATIILSVVFFLLITPISFILKLLGKDYMDKKYNKEISTYRIETKNRNSKHMEKPY